MKKLILLSLFITTVLFANKGEPTIVNMVFNSKEDYPYCLGNGKDIQTTNPGIAIDAMRTIEKKLNIKFNFIRETWTRQQKKIQYNKVDMLFIASYKKSREKLGVFPRNSDGTVDDTKRTISSSYVIFKLKNSPLDWDGEKFINLTGKISTQKGYSIVSFLKEKGAEVIENNSDTDIKKLLHGRVEGIAMHNNRYKMYFKDNPEISSKIIKLPIPLTTKPYYVLTSHKFYKNNQILVNKIWEELKDMDKLEKFKTIRERY